MNWNYKTSPTIPREGNKYQVFQDKKQLTFQEVIQLWQDNSDFRLFYNKMLKDAPFSAYFWEHPAVKNSTLEKPYEFVLINSTSLKGIWSNERSFAEHFKANKPIATFRNLSKKSMLIAPCPMMDKNNYAHLSRFVRRSSEEQMHAFWQTVGETYQQMLDEQWRWLSTSGLGVYWLHVRIDDRPKYYTFRPYKKDNFIV